MYPRIKKINNLAVNEVEVNYYTNNQGLIVNKEKCVGCGICVKVCPKSAIQRLPLDGKVKITTEDLIPTIPDPIKCSYCGTCVYMCPFSAITLKKKGNEIKLEDLDIITKNVVPSLKYEEIMCHKGKKSANVYMKGKLEVDWEKCVFCMSCVGVCPTAAFFKVEKKDISADKPRKVSVNPDLCISCGTCVDSCSKEAISLAIEDISFTGSYKEIFWLPLIFRLKTK
jgi:ferredoxin